MRIEIEVIYDLIFMLKTYLNAAEDENKSF